MTKHTLPMQPVAVDDRGTLRFVANRIVRDLLDKATAAKIMDLNTIAIDAQVHGKYTKQERQQFAQLIGYSIGGYGELSQYVDSKAWSRANRKANKVRRPHD